MNMKTKKVDEKKIEAVEILEQLEEYLTERIWELYEKKGGQQERQALTLYRDNVFKAISLLQ